MTVETKRAYYTDPLAAAWMAKHFRMIYNPTFPGTDTEVNDRASTHPDWFLYIRLFDQMLPKRFYIHPDSLHLLEPQDGDWGWVNTLVDYAREDTVEVYICAKHDLNVRGEFRIIQRNCIAFMWPEFE